LKVISNIIKEIHISHLFKTNLDNLTHIETISERPQLAWINGIIFIATEFDSEKLTIELTKEGILYLDTFSYAECKEKPDQLKWNGFKVDVFDLSGHPTYEKLIDSILENEK